MGVVKGINYAGTVNKIKLECSIIIEGMKPGDSISVNGVCLTVAEMGDRWFEADVMPETLRKTSLDVLKVGNRVNLEPALKLGDRFGGHIVSGHIDGIGVIKHIKDEQNARWITVELPEELMKYVVMKGSVAIEGTSLTVAQVEGNTFGVSLIPTTRFVTILGQKKAGDKVNIECDIIGKYIESLIKPNEDTNGKNGGIDMEFLGQHGFI